MARTPLHLPPLAGGVPRRGEGGSGVAAYDVQVKVDDGEWTSWLTATTATEGVYAGELGHLYTFRLRATDHVSNTGAWAEASTIVVQVTKYYTFGGQRIAMRQGGVVYYLHTDHLRSVSLITDHASRITARQRYYPYGEVRWNAGTLPTDFTFTGQRNEGAIGLYDYGPRWYDPVIGRFIQPDSIVPEPANPQSLNRYAYVLNNPLRYTDPTGHAECVEEECSLVFHPVSGEIIRRGPGVSYWNQSGMGLFWDWYFEQGPETRYYGRAAALTKDVMNDEGVQAARDVFYRSSGEPLEGHLYSFDRPIQPIREAAQWLSGEDKTGAGSVLGSYTVYIANNGDGTITICVHNITGRESGSRLLGSGPILETAPTEYYEQLWSGVQEMLSGDASLGSLKKLWPVSVFENRTREQTGPSSLPWVGANGWGGNLEQWYMWTEALCTDCMR